MKEREDTGREARKGRSPPFLSEIANAPQNLNTQDLSTAIITKTNKDDAASLSNRRSRLPLFQRRDHHPLYTAQWHLRRCIFHFSIGCYCEREKKPKAPESMNDVTSWLRIKKMPDQRTLPGTMVSAKSLTRVGGKCKTVRFPRV